MFSSQLYDEKTFYQKFLRDLENCESEIIIESPYITCERMKTFDRIFEKLIKRGVRIFFITRDPKEHDRNLETQSEEVISYCERLGIQVLLCLGNHHRKLAILDRKILWEGSLNILSQTYSREIMRRIEDKNLTMEMFNFLKLSKFL
jgi:phosphatidylserine/phosphatidylglycerophosphate/cardiolipin synthase-like enzyme